MADSKNNQRKQIDVPQPKQDKPINTAKSIREIQQEKARASAERRSVITVQNISNQKISIHLNPPPGVDFYIGAEDKPLRPGQQATFQKSRARMDQITRLQKMGKIQVISDNTPEESNTKEVRIKK